MVHSISPRSLMIVTLFPSLRLHCDPENQQTNETSICFLDSNHLKIEDLNKKIRVLISQFVDFVDFLCCFRFPTFLIIIRPPPPSFSHHCGSEIIQTHKTLVRPLSNHLQMEGLNQKIQVLPSCFVDLLTSMCVRFPLPPYDHKPLPLSLPHHCGPEISNQ